MLCLESIVSIHSSDEDTAMYEAEHDERRFTIEEDFPEVGAYLYVFQNEKCIRDFLQNDVDACKQFALKEYGVPLSKWRSRTGAPDSGP